MHRQIPNILLVEDNPGDVELIKAFLADTVAMPVSVNYTEYILEQRAARNSNSDRPDWLGGDEHPADEHSWIRFSVVTNAEDAMRFLQHDPPYDHAARPDLILLDLNLPGVGGHDLLERIKSDPRLTGIDVVVFTSSDHPRDIDRAYELGAGCYIRKPDSIDDFPTVAGAIKRYWFGVSRQRLQTA